MAKSKSVRAKAKKVAKVKAVKNGVTHTTLTAAAVAQYKEHERIIKKFKLNIKPPKSNFISKPHGERMLKLRDQAIAEAYKQEKAEGKQRKPRTRAAKAEQHASA